MFMYKQQQKSWCKEVQRKMKGPKIIKSQQCNVKFILEESKQRTKKAIRDQKKNKMRTILRYGIFKEKQKRYQIKIIQLKERNHIHTKVKINGDRKYQKSQINTKAIQNKVKNKRKA